MSITALCNAIEDGRVDSALILLERHDSVYKRKKDRLVRPLYLAVRRNAVDVIEGLVQLDVNVNAYYRGLRTALMWAAAEGHSAVIRKMINSGAHLDSRSRASDPSSLFGALLKKQREETALTLAVRGKYTECVRLLIDAGADVNIPGIDRNKKKEETALSVAVKLGFNEVAAMLIEAGADILAALSIARDEKNHACITFLEAAVEAKTVQSLAERKEREKITFVGMLDDVKSSDVHFHVSNDAMITANSYVLKYRQSKLLDLVPLTEKTFPVVVDLTEVSATVLRAYLHYIYVDDCHFSSLHATQILHTVQFARKMECERLARLGEQYLRSHMNMDILYPLLKEAHETQDMYIKNLCLNFAHKHMEEFLEQKAKARTLGVELFQEVVSLSLEEYIPLAPSSVPIPPSSFIEDLTKLYMSTANKESTDTHVVIGGETISFHRLIFGSHSACLAAVLESANDANVTGALGVSDMKPDTFRMILKLAYGTDPDMMLEQVREIYPFTRRFKLPQMEVIMAVTIFVSNPDVFGSRPTDFDDLLRIFRETVSEGEYGGSTLTRNHGRSDNMEKDDVYGTVVQTHFKVLVMLCKENMNEYLFNVYVSRVTDNGEIIALDAKDSGLALLQHVQSLAKRELVRPIRILDCRKRVVRHVDKLGPDSIMQRLLKLKSDHYELYVEYDN